MPPPPVPPAPHHHKGHNKGALVAAIVVPLVIFAVGAIGAYVWWLRRQEENEVEADIRDRLLTNVSSERGSFD